MVWSILLLACATPEAPRFEGRVVDLWGHPIGGATVLLVGASARATSDGEGRFQLPREPGTWELKAGREGYIPNRVEVSVDAETDRGPTLVLFPKPEKHGFYVVSSGRYVTLEPTDVTEVSTSLHHHRGLKTVGEVGLDGPEVRVLFHTDLRPHELSLIDLELVRLDFVGETEVRGPLGAALVRVNLYQPEATLPYELEPLRSGEDWLLEAQLEPGFYAFQTQKMLQGMSQEQFEQTPIELRRAWPFWVR